MIVGSVLAILIVAVVVSIVIRKHKHKSKEVDLEGNLQVISFKTYQHNLQTKLSINLCLNFFILKTQLKKM